MLVDVLANLRFSSAYLVQSFEVTNTINCPVRENERWMRQNFPFGSHCPVNISVVLQFWGKKEKEVSKKT